MTTQFNAAARLGITVSKNARTAPKSQPRRFTDAFVRQLKPDRARRIEVCDALTTGLLLRATPNGFKTFALHTRAPSGKTMRITPGRYPGISLATARVGERAPRGHRARDRSVRRLRPIALRFLMLTLSRLGEALDARWKHIDFDERTWTKCV